MKRALRTLLFIIASILLVWVLKQVFPKNTGVLNFFLVFLFLDALLWMITWREIRDLKPLLRGTLAILFWIPFGLLVAGVIFGFFSNFYDWPRFVKTYLTSVVFVGYATRIFPVGFLLISLFWQGTLLLLARVAPQLKPFAQPLRKFFVAGWILGILLFLGLLSGMIFWEHQFKVRTTEIPVKDLPPSFDGLRIVQLSDLHLGSWNRASKLRELVDIVNELKPDLFFFTGDLCNYSTTEVWPFQDILQTIHARYGIYAILGNHDYGAYRTWDSDEAKRQNMQDLYRFYDEMGWKLLRNENEILGVDGDSLAIIGVENWGAVSRFQRLADLPRALKGTEYIPAKLLLSHDPTHWDSIVNRQYPDIDITFSGHTHGGQVGIESENWQWSFVQYLYPEWAGLYTTIHDDGTSQYLYVNRGAGTIGYAGRVGIWAEVTLVVLQGK